MAVGTAVSAAGGHVDPPVGLSLIDADVHDMTTVQETFPYLPERSRRYLEMIGLRQRGPMSVAQGAWKMASRVDAWGPEGQLPGTYPPFFCEQLFGGSESQIAILNPGHGLMQERYGPGTPAWVLRDLHRAHNELVREKWLEFDSRLRGAIVLPMNDTKGSVEEIERCASEQRFVQILLPLVTAEPMGQERFWDIYEAAVHHNLPIGMHPATQHTLSGAGWPSFYFELHAAYPSALFAQVASLVAEGTFDRFPDLQIVFIEGGWSWVPPLMRRLDRAYRMLRDEVGHLKQRPSDYLRTNFWFTTQPVDQPENPAHLLGVFEEFAEEGLGDKLMFSSDYPHWDYDDPATILPHGLSEEARQAILVANALACYKRLAV